MIGTTATKKHTINEMEVSRRNVENKVECAKKKKHLDANTDYEEDLQIRSSTYNRFDHLFFALTSAAK